VGGAPEKSKKKKSVAEPPHQKRTNFEEKKPGRKEEKLGVAILRIQAKGNGRLPKKIMGGMGEGLLQAQHIKA